MSDTLPPRPTFTDGQYIGAADLNAAVAYARDGTQRLALSGQSWGIATGLALVEVTDTTGGVQMFIEPGIAWDGYGRPVVVLSPAPVTPDLFNGFGTAPQPVWLCYTATATQAVTPGFLTCGAGDPATRVQESYLVVGGTQTATSAGVVIGGATVPDPRDMLTAVDQNAAVVLDGSAPQQSFPGDTAVWLIPVGIVLYNAGSPGSFSSRDAVTLKNSRLARRYIGAIAESVLASDGVLRLRDRQTDNPNAATDAALDAAAAVQQSDIGTDPNNATRLVGNELVWVEGNMRVTGHARLFGTQLELRDSNGTTGASGADVPQFLRRAAPASNPLQGQDLQICFARPADTTGTNRLTIGVAAAATPVPPATSVAPSSNTPDGALTEVMVVRADGRVAIGTNAIDGYSALANTLVVATPADSGITIASATTSTGNLFFADGTSSASTATPTPPQMDGFVSYDHKAQVMTLGAAATTVLALTGTGQAIIGPASPAGFAGDTDQLIVASSSGAAGITISGTSGTIGSIDFANGATAPFDAGFIRYNLASNQMSFGTNSAPQVCIDSAGQVGIGTQAPGSTDPNAQLVVASYSGDASVTVAAASGFTSFLNFGNTGLLPVGGVSYDTATDRMDFQTSENIVVSFDSQGNVGIGTSTPVGQLHVKSPIVGSPYSLVLDTFTIQALLGAAASPLQLQPEGSSVGIGTATPGALLQVHATAPNQSTPALIVDNDSGATALWAGAGSVAIGVAGPARTTLDVRGAVPGSGAFPAASNHLAIFENTETGTGAANVLALAVDTTTSTECHFVTFYSGGSEIGAIIGVGAGSGTVNYSTVAADYAEAAPRAANVARIGPKQIVGVRGGQVSLVTEAADAVFVTSEAPAMLARRPHRDQQDAYETLAFLGQVHVLVDGPVRSGDLIVASGKADGKGRAVALHEVRPEDLAMIVGRAWESVDDASESGVNAVVGPGVATAPAAGAILARQAGAIDAQAEASRLQAEALRLQEAAIEAQAEANRQQAAALRLQKAAIAAQAAENQRLAAEIKRLAAQMARRKAPAAR